MRKIYAKNMWKKNIKCRDQKNTFHDIRIFLFLQNIYKDLPILISQNLILQSVKYKYIFTCFSNVSSKLTESRN